MPRDNQSQEEIKIEPNENINTPCPGASNPAGEDTGGRSYKESKVEMIYKEVDTGGEGYKVSKVEKDYKEGREEGDAKEFNKEEEKGVDHKEKTENNQTC